MKKYIIIVLYLVLIFIVFKFLFLNVPISGGDYITVSHSLAFYWKQFSFFAWDPKVNLGMSTIALLYSAPMTAILGILGSLIGSVIAERIVWWVPFFVISYFSITKLYKYIFPQNFMWILTSLIFIFNTYILLILGGGQISGIGLAYAIAPLVLVSFIRIIDSTRISNFKSVFAGLILSIQIMFDIRIAYITLLIIGLYFVFCLVQNVKFSKSFFLNTCSLILATFFIPGIVSFLLHAFWLVPTILFHSNPIAQLGSAYNSTGAVQFFSFAKFENSISLLHPNWPENIFGKTYFQRPEFLLLPILAFSSLLFMEKSKVKNQKSKIQFESQKYDNNLAIEPFQGKQYSPSRVNNITIYFFVLLSIVGAFLAKGAQDPFGGIYLWMFSHVPGFFMFRDSTKFYLLIAISYSILIPFTLSRMSEIKIFKNRENLVSYLLLAIFLIFYFSIIRQAIFGQLSGTFKSHPIPQEYTQLENYLQNDSQYGRVLWIPISQRFGYFSAIHPEINASDFFKTGNLKTIIADLKNPEIQTELQNDSIKYMVIPDDTEKELFIKNRKYDSSQYSYIVKSLDAFQTEVLSIDNIKLYKLNNSKDHFYLNSSQAKVSYNQVTPTQYIVHISNVKAGDQLIFSESFDSNWMIGYLHNGRVIRFSNSQIYNKMLNSFILPKDGNYTVEIYYLPQNFVNVGMIISSISLILVIGYLILSFSSRNP